MYLSASEVAVSTTGRYNKCSTFTFHCGKAASRGLLCYCTPLVIQGALMRQATEMLTMTMIMIKTLQMMAIMRKTMCKCRFCNIFYVFFKYFGGHLGL